METDLKLAREARAIVALILRNGPIEDIHTGKVCPTCGRDPTYSRITDDEIKQIMKCAVDRIYSLLWLKDRMPEHYGTIIQIGETFTMSWDQPVFTSQF